MKAGYSTIWLIADNYIRVPIGIAVWDSNRNWYGTRFLQEGEPSSLKPELMRLVKLAEKQINDMAKSGIVPYYEKEIPAWRSQYWEWLEKAFQSGIQLDPPRALSIEEDISSQLENLFTTIVFSGRERFAK